MDYKVKKSISFNGMNYVAGDEVSLDSEIAKAYGSEYLEAIGGEFKPPKKAYKNKQLRTYKVKKVAKRSRRKK